MVINDLSIWIMLSKFINLVFKFELDILFEHKLDFIYIYI